MDSSATPFRTACQQVLNSPELARLIIDITNEGTTEKTMDSRTLATLATVNQPFFDASTDLLWQFVPSLSPFLKLLPGCHEKGGRAEPVIDRVCAEAWSRFRVYSPKLTRLTLAALPYEVEEQMPMHWFFYLSQRPLKPAILFPRLKQLTVLSLSSLNAIIPFHVLPTLRTLFISDFSKEIPENVATSLITSCALDAPLLWKITLKSELAERLTSAFSQIPSLSKLTLTLPLSFIAENVLFLSQISGLRTLSLKGRGGRRRLPSFPAEGKHLQRSIPELHSEVTTINLEGDGYFLLSIASHFSFSSLQNFVGKIPLISSYPAPQVLLTPHILHHVVHHNPKLHQLSMEWETPRNSPGFTIHPDWELGILEEHPQLRISPDLLPSVAKLHDLEILSIKNILFITPDFAVQLLDQLVNMPHLHTLCLVALPLSEDAPHELVAPTLQCLRKLARENRSLKSITMTVDLSDIPTGSDETSRHGLKNLFMIPANEETTLSMTKFVALSTYLDSLFPDIEDLTSYFEHASPSRASPRSRRHLAGAPREPLEMWKNLDTFLKSYQALRRRMEVQHRLELSAVHTKAGE